MFSDLRGGAGLLSQAKAAGRLAKTARKIGKGGLAAGRVAARGGRAARGLPWAALGVAAWGVGNGGWFWWKAHAYNRRASTCAQEDQQGGGQPRLTVRAVA